MLIKFTEETKLAGGQALAVMRGREFMATLVSCRNDTKDEGQGGAGKQE